MSLLPVFLVLFGNPVCIGTTIRIPLSGLTSIISIDGNVFRRQVASNHYGASGSVSKINANFNELLVGRVVRMLVILRIFHVIAQFLLHFLPFQNKLATLENHTSAQR